jgi:hypothetical protein
MKEAVMEQARLPLDHGSSVQRTIRPEAPVKGTIIGVCRTQEVFINGVELLRKDSLRPMNHSPTGFAWGYGGSGPAQLALAILLKFVNEPTALSLHQDFKREVIAQLDGKQPFCLLVKRIRAWLGSKGVRV